MQLCSRHSLRSEQIAAVALRVHPLALELTGIKAPRSGLESKWSLYHSAAVAIVDNAAGEDQYTDERVHDPGVSQLRECVTAEADTGLREDEAYVAITLRDGQILERHIEHAIGSLGHPLIAEMVASGEIPIALDAHIQGVERLKKRGAPIEWKALQPAFGQPSSIGVAERAPHPHAALLFADFVLSKEGQEIIKARNRVPVSAAVDSPLNKFKYGLVDPVIVLDEWDKWSKLWSQLFLGGNELKKVD